ncbi:MAG: hypothetical protein QOH48_1217 [Actinomycetota bacterium]|nr:hypothetical protein [Actinomycetota bacterium]
MGWIVALKESGYCTTSVLVTRGGVPPLTVASLKNARVVAPLYASNQLSERAAEADFIIHKFKGREGGAVPCFQTTPNHQKAGSVLAPGKIASHKWS